jgi:hypothetical protein
MCWAPSSAAQAALGMYGPVTVRFEWRKEFGQRTYHVIGMVIVDQWGCVSDYHLCGSLFRGEALADCVHLYSGHPATATGMPMLAGLMTSDQIFIIKPITMFVRV